MTRKTFEDVVKTKKIEKIKPSFEEVFPSNRRVITKNILDTREKKSISDKMLWVIAFISVIALFFAISFFFSRATISVNPKIKDFNVNKTLTATKNSNDAVGLTYDLVALSGEEKKEVVGGEEKEYKESAVGKVLIYNSFSVSNQTILSDTKLEGTNGKIYKVKNKVIVPGMSKNNTPGKIGADIYAEKEGEEYNSDPIDFKILPFKGTSKYTKVYARSVGDISGGLLGKSRQVSEEDEINLFKELEDSLSKKLLEKAKNQIPKNFVLLNGATSVVFDEEGVVPSETKGSFIFSIKGTFTGILFDKDRLIKEVTSEFLENNAIDVSSGEASSITEGDVYTSNIDNLAISSFDQSSINLNDMKDLNFNLSGIVKIVWKVDNDKLITDLLGKSKNDFNQILTRYENIDSANMTIKPVWANSFPGKMKDIKVVVNYPN